MNLKKKLSEKISKLENKDLKKLDEYLDSLSYKKKKGLIKNFSIKKNQIILAGLVGIITGSLIKIYIEVPEYEFGFFSKLRETEFFAIALIFYLGFLSFFLLSAKRKILKPYLFIISNLIILLPFLIIITGIRSFSAGSIYYFFFALLVFICFGLSISSLYKDKIIDSLNEYLYKSLEIFAVGIFLSVVLSGIWGMFIGLFSLIDIEINDDIIELIFIILAVSGPLFSTSLFFDFKKDLVKQSKNIEIFGKIFYAISFILAIFLFIYILVLTPLGFKKILDTNNTVPLFGSVSILCAFCIFISREILKEVSKNTKLLFSVILVEIFVLVSVAIYAMKIRVDNFGLTTDRITSFYFLFVLLICVLFYLLVLIFQKKLFFKKAALINFSASILVIIFCFSSMTFLDLETISIKSHFSLSIKNEKPLDSRFLERSELKDIEFLKDEYFKGDKKTRFTILLAFSKFPENNYYLDYEKSISKINMNNFVKSFFDEVESKEADSNLKEYLSLAQELRKLKEKNSKEQNNYEKEEEKRKELLEKCISVYEVIFGKKHKDFCDEAWEF